MAQPRDAKGRFIKKGNDTMNTTTNTTTNNTTNTKENTIMRNAQVKRMEVMENAGLDTSKFFKLSLEIPTGSKVSIKVDDQEISLTGNTTDDMKIAAFADKVNSAISSGVIATSDVKNAMEGTIINSGVGVNTDINKVEQMIIDNGYVNNPKLFRRWICSQMLRMISWTSWNGSKSGYDAYIRTFYSFDYQFKSMIEELKRMDKMKRDNDPMFDECHYFLNEDVVADVMEDYLHRLKKYIKNARTKRTRKYRGHEYVRLANHKLGHYGDVLVENLDREVYAPIAIAIETVRRTHDVHSLVKVLERFMNTYYCKLPYDTAKSVAWKNYFKGTGAYFTLQNLIRFHYQKNGNPFMIECYDTGELLTRTEADRYLRSLLDVYARHEQWKLFAVLTRALEINDFDFIKSIDKCNLSK